MNREHIKSKTYNDIIKKSRFLILPIWKDTSKVETLADFTEALTKTQFSLRCFMSFQTSRKSCNFGLLFKNVEEKNRFFCTSETIKLVRRPLCYGNFKKLLPRKEQNMLFNEFKYQRKCSSQLFDNLNHAVSRFPFIIRSAGRKHDSPTLQGMFHRTIKGCSHIFSVDRQ